MFYLFVISAIHDKECDVQNGGNRWYISLNFRKRIVFREESLFRNSICIPLPFIYFIFHHILDRRTEKKNSKLDTKNCSTSVLNKSSNLNLFLFETIIYLQENILKIFDSFYPKKLISRLTDNNDELNKKNHENLPCLVTYDSEFRN